mmetsp:Transcript_110024/g.320266  ORF Transcript_110024/g.320266 Transcript_110024/m.320266 type:complete len:143 (-) Transcript_110024:1019-1447(-)
MAVPAGWIRGFANGHSHAFQRQLRGLVQRRDPSLNDSFWTWREKMYAISGTMDVNELENAARSCYIEMLEAGYTAVGEFHYVHHQANGESWVMVDHRSSSALHSYTLLFRSTLHSPLFHSFIYPRPTSRRQRGYIACHDEGR